jgi:carbamoyl-phosphate synthase large subunit
LKNILVSGASGIVGYGVLRSLRKACSEYKLISTTIYDDSVAQGFSDIFEQAPLTSDAGYIEWLIYVIKKHSVEFLIPGIEADLYKWVDHIPEIEATGAVVLMNNVQLISICKDKWEFFKHLNSFQSPYVIDSSLTEDFDKLIELFGLPFLLKPRRGFGSKGIVIVNDRETFLKCEADLPGLIAQRIVGDVNEEYTTSAFCDGLGSYYCHMTLKRKLSKEGFTDKAEVVVLEGVEEALNSLCGVYKPIGPTNFQFRKQDGILKLLEINPRISSSTSIRAAFGYNESQMAVEYYLENKEPVQPVIRLGKAVRYTEDFIFYL